jgi:glycosyltransferase involved in cell wall biosynthesis
LRTLGHKVIIVSPPGIDVFEEDVTEKRENPRRSKLAGIWSWLSKHIPQIAFELLEICYNFTAERNIKKALSKNKIDFIYERYSFFTWAGAKLAGQYDIPFILEVNEVSGITRQRGQVLVGLAGRIEKGVFSKADSIIVVSSFLKEQVIKKGVSAGKISVIPNAVDISRFDTNISGKSIREKYGLGGKTVLGFVGHFSRWDRLDSLMDIFRDIASRDPKVHMLLVGDTAKESERKELERCIDVNSLRDRVLITGRVSRSDIPGFIAAMDMCLIPNSNPFGSPLVLFEYMAMGKAVIAPRYPPLEDVVTDGINGLLFDAGEIGSMKNKIERLAVDNESRIRLGKQARISIIEEHLWKHNAEKISDIYQKVIKHG